MPQIFQVLRCYKCSIFQIHLTRKDFKWTCKVCSEKQSVKRHYGIGTGKDCRMHVQKLNQMRGEMEEIKVIYSDDSSDNDVTFEATNKLKNVNKIKNIKSKWETYVDTKQEHETNEEEPQYLGDKEVVLEIPQKRKIKRKFIEPTKFSKTIEHSEPETYTNEQCGSKSPNAESSNELNCNLSLTNISSKNADETTIVKSLSSNYNDEDILKPRNKIDTFDQKIERTSKWAGYVEVNDTIDKDSEENINKNYHAKQLFSLCDDNDLDKILDF